jgi:hypothetical protein
MRSHVQLLLRTTCAAIVLSLSLFLALCILTSVTPLCATAYVSIVVQSECVQSHHIIGLPLPLPAAYLLLVLLLRSLPVSLLVLCLLLLRPKS